MKNNMLDFLNERKYCVISTVDANDKPESAFVAYSNEGLELFIGTSNKSRKFANLIANPSVAVVVADETGEVQYEGQAMVVDPENYSEVEESHLSKIPGSRKYRDDPTQVYIHISPTWIRYIEHGEPDIMEEFTEF
jgi:general stress protein 26